MKCHKVRAYRNLNNGKISLQCCTSGLVIGHCDKVFLVNVDFVVRESGRQKVLASRRKNVHAFVVGELGWIDGYNTFCGRQIDGFNVEPQVDQKGSKRVLYNPYEMSTFCDVDFQPIYAAEACWISSDGKIFVKTQS